MWSSRIPAFPDRPQPRSRHWRTGPASGKSRGRQLAAPRVFFFCSVLMSCPSFRGLTIRLSRVAQRRDSATVATSAPDEVRPFVKCFQKCRRRTGRQNSKCGWARNGSPATRACRGYYARRSLSASRRRPSGTPRQSSPSPAVHNASTVGAPRRPQVGRGTEA